MTALMFAVNKRRIDLADLLLRHRAQVYVQNKVRLVCDVMVEFQDGWTALMYAVKENSLALFELLLKHDAQIDLKAQVSHTIASLAYVACAHAL